MKRLILVLTAFFVLTTMMAQVKVDLPGANRTGGVDKSNALTIGFLNGGGALIGADLERLVYNKLGIQIGLGYAAYGFGVNYHFKPYINSSFIKMEYWHQGFGYNYVQSLVGASFVFRARKYLQAQLGFGYQVDLSYYHPELAQNFMAMYAIGIYLPL